MLRGGAEVVRLLSRKTKGCGTFKDCDHGGVHLNAADPLERTRNWFTFYCPGHPQTEALVKDCLQTSSSTTDTRRSYSSSTPTYRCFTRSVVMIDLSSFINDYDRKYCNDYFIFVVGIPTGV